MKFAIRAFLTVVLVGSVIWWAGPQDLARAIAAIQIQWLAAMILLVLLFVFIGAVGVCILTKALSPKHRIALIFKSYLRAFALGMLAPSKLGELSYSYYVTEGEANYGLGLAVVVIDKAVTLVLLLLAGAIGIAIYVGHQEALITVAIAVLGALAAGAALRSDSLRSRVRSYILGTRQQYFKGFSQHLASLVTKHRGALAINIALTILRMLVLAGAIQLGFRSLGSRVDLPSIVVVMAAVQLVSWLPVTLSGLGLSHGSAALLFTTCCGVARHVTVDLFLINSLLAYALAGCVVIVWGLKKEVPMGGQQDKRD